MMIAGGLVTQKPFNDGNNNQEQELEKQANAQREAMMKQLEAQKMQPVDPNLEKKWSVPYN